MVKNLPANAGHARDVGSISESGRSFGEGNGNPPLSLLVVEMQKSHVGRLVLLGISIWVICGRKKFISYFFPFYFTLCNINLFG